jgi:choline/glycine/proline betaine transport protein
MPLKATFNPRVFWGASFIIAIFLAVGIAFPHRADHFFGLVQTTIIEGFGWFYILVVAIFLGTVIFLAISRYGTLRLGPDNAQPEYSYLSWIAMLFAAGMGIGLMFFAVAEPIQHFSAPPEGTANTLSAARQALVITFFHWGVHAWAIYAVVGLSLAYFSFRYNLPLTIRSGLYPLFREHINGWLGDAVDIFAVCGTLFGIATSMGFGVLQINAGLTHLFGIPQSVMVQIILITIVTILSSLSVMSGLDGGIRRLSEINLLLAATLMIFVLIVGPTGFLLKVFVQNIGGYLDNFFVRTFNLYAYRPGSWDNNWTLFYWAWWIAWSPFVGMFIARISRGRTVREFVSGVLLVPTLFTFLWMTIFGNTAIVLDMTTAAGHISAEVTKNVPVALFQFLERLPLSNVTSLLAVLLVAVFFITSADSGSLVIDTLATGGIEDAPVWQRIYWCCLEGGTAALLLVAGGLSALQTITLVSALPFAIIMLLLVAGLFRGMRADMARTHTLTTWPIRPSGAGLHWRSRLQALLHSPTRKEVTAFIDKIAEPALREVAAEMGHRNQPAHLSRRDDGSITLTVPAEGKRDFNYSIQPQRHVLPVFSAGDTARSEARRPHEWQARTVLLEGMDGYDMMGCSAAQLINDVLTQFSRYQTLVTSEATALYIGSPDASS